MKYLQYLHGHNTSEQENSCSNDIFEISHVRGKGEPRVHQFDDDKEPYQPEYKEDFKVNAKGKEHEHADDHEPDRTDYDCQGLFLHQFHLIVMNSGYR